MANSRQQDGARRRAPVIFLTLAGRSLSLLKINDAPRVALARHSWILRSRCRRWRGLQRRIDPTRMDPSVEAIGGFGINCIGMQNQAAECHLDMAARAAETVIKIEVAKGRVEIVAP